MELTLLEMINEIEKEERRLVNTGASIIEEAQRMTIFLKDLLLSVKYLVQERGFEDQQQEIHFFRETKPLILGKLIYYNKVFRMETACPFSGGEMLKAYYKGYAQTLEEEFSRHADSSSFYRYYRSGRTDKDANFFVRGNINYGEGINSFAFELDTTFSTFYDYKVAKILANDLLFAYLQHKGQDGSSRKLPAGDLSDQLSWTASKSAFIELVYALHAFGAVCGGKIGIRRLCAVFAELLGIELLDLHHSFHRMKTRAGSRTKFIDELRDALENYMDKDLG